MSRFYLTTAIDYVNSRPHLGHGLREDHAPTSSPATSGSRGVDTRFLMGNDEHSQNVFKKARRSRARPAGVLRPDGAGVPRRLAARSTSRSTTSSARPSRATSAGRAASWRSASTTRGDIYEGVYEGWYCVGCEAFKQEKDLVDGKCPLHPTTTPEWIKEKNYFFRLSKYQQPLLDHFAAHPEFLAARDPPQRDPAALEGGLEDISISRAGQSWGIPLPFDPDERRVRLVRRAHQLRVGRRATAPTRRCSSSGGRPTCTSSARTSRASTA